MNNLVMVNAYSDYSMLVTIGIYEGTNPIDQEFLDNTDDWEEIEKYMKSNGYKKVKVKEVNCGGNL